MRVGQNGRGRDCRLNNVRCNCNRILFLPSLIRVDTLGIHLKKILATSLLLISISATAEEIDTRRALPMNEMQRGHILSEMRALLAGTQGILSALTREDMASVADHARPLGTGMPHKGEDHMKAILPQEFMQMGMMLHRDFDQIAADAESLKDPKHTLKQLSDSMGKCVACHASYQIRVTGPSKHSQSKTIRHNH